MGLPGRVRLDAELAVTIADVASFLADPHATAKLSGTVTADTLGEDLRIEEGHFNLTPLSQVEGSRMSYQGTLRTQAGVFAFHAYKEIVHFGGLASIPDAARDMTSFLTVLRAGDMAGPIYGAGVMHFHLRDLPEVLHTIQTPGVTGRKRERMIATFLRAAYGPIAEAFLIGFVRSPAEEER